MTRPRTASLDAQIISLLDSGLAPKEVAARLKLKNKWRVYRARRRAKMKMPKIARDKSQPRGLYFNRKAKSIMSKVPGRIAGDFFMPGVEPG